MAASKSPGKTGARNRNVEDDVEVEIIPIDNYNAETGKLKASVSWLIAKVYGSNVPDHLTSSFSTEENDTVTLKPLVVQCLTSGELYCRAASTIFHDPSLINQGHSGVIHALQRCQIAVIDSDTGETVREGDLIMREESPFKLTAHLAVMDALMIGHMRDTINVEGVVAAVKKYTNVHRNEQPVDAENAILFWINKICATVRDNLVQEQQNNQETPLIPEIDDLYEDICDGTCAATVIHFYRPDELPFHEICFNDPMSIADCAHNLRLLSQFCQRHLPWYIFHFSIEDMLYMHENLQPNVCALFADLFYFLESQQGEKSQVKKTRQLKPRRSLPDKVDLSEMRTGDKPKNQTTGGKPTVPPDTVNIRRDTTMNSITSRLSSTDSLVTDRSMDSLRYRAYAASVAESPLTGPASHGGTPSQNITFPIGPTITENVDGYQQYQRSHTLPTRQAGASAAVRLQLEQKRREFEEQQYQESGKLAEERNRLSKDAFYTLLGRSTSNYYMSSSASPVHTGSTPQAATLLRRKANTPTREYAPNWVHSDGGDGRSNLNNLTELSKSIQEMRQEMKRLSMEQAKLQRFVDPTSLGITPMPSGSMIYAAPTFAQHPTPAAAAAAHFHVLAAAPYAMDENQIPYASAFDTIGQMYPTQQIGQTAGAGVNGSGPSLSQLHMTRSVASPSFKLHDGEGLSRLDPSLELRKTMSDWGMTYRVPQKSPRRTWADQTFVGQQQRDGSVSAREPAQQTVPVMDHDQGHSMVEVIPSEPVFLRSPTSVMTRSSDDFGTSLDAAVSPATNATTKMSTSAPTDTINANTVPRGASPGIGFIVGDDDRGKQMELQKKRDQIMSNALRRRELMEQRRARVDIETARKREEKQQQDEIDEQRKREREQHRHKIRQEYQRRKGDPETLELSSGSASATRPTTPQSPRTLPRSHNQLQRNRSQPPTRPKSQVLNGKTLGATSPGMVPSTSADNLDRLESKPQNSRGIVPFSVVPPEPTLKLFVKPTQKSNRNLVLNAIQYCVLAGVVNQQMKQKVLTELAKSDSKHFLILFRDKKCQFKALYDWDQVSDNVHKLCGLGPNTCLESYMDLMFKYDSGAKQFTPIPTRHLSAQIDGFTVKEEYWQKKKPVYSPRP